MPVAPAGLRLVPARTGDHPLIHRLLLSVFHGPSSAEFHAQLEEPGYQPSDRLVVKDRDHVAAHLRLARQSIQLESAVLPAVRFMDLATAPEFRSRGFATALLSAGLREARAAGALVAVTRTAAPELFAQQGWAICGKHTFSSAPPRAILAELGAIDAPQDEVAALTAVLCQPRCDAIFVRPLRRIELPAIVRLYRDEGRRHSGWPVRSEAYFEWLMARGACDRVYIAANCPETGDIKRLHESIVGYAFVRQCRIVELVTAPGRDDVARELATRACADASEQDGWQVRLDAPGSHRLHELWRQAGGKLTCDQELGGEYFMARLLDPLAVLRQVAMVLTDRGIIAGMEAGSELGIELRGPTGEVKGNGHSDDHSVAAPSARPPRGVVERYRMCLNADGMQIETGGPLKHMVVMRSSDLAPLLLGDIGAEEMLATGRLRAATRTARQLITGLFPAACWWRPPLDDLLA